MTSPVHKDLIASLGQLQTHLANLDERRLQRLSGDLSALADDYLREGDDELYHAAVRLNLASGVHAAVDARDELGEQVTLAIAGDYAQWLDADAGTIASPSVGAMCDCGWVVNVTGLVEAMRRLVGHRLLHGQDPWDDSDWPVRGGAHTQNEVNAAYRDAARLGPIPD